jgi:exonuclease VII large subunit
MTLTVSQLINVINTALEPLSTVTVEGEVEEFKILQNKWVTFKIRDEASSIGCFMPVWQFRTQVEDPASQRFFQFCLEFRPAGGGRRLKARV